MTVQLEGAVFDALATDTTLSATTVSNTGKTSDVYTLHGYEYAMCCVKCVFPNPATDDLTVEVWSTIDGTKFQSVVDNTWTFTRTAGATKYQNFIVHGTQRMLDPGGTNYIQPTYGFKVILKASGATDTPTVTLYTRKVKSRHAG